MSEARQVAVLFADVAGSTKLYELEGDSAAMQAIALCIARLGQCTEASGGRVVKTIGDEIMAVFPTTDAAAMAASAMQSAIDALPPVGNTRLAVRIGFHFGPIIQNGSDIFGDTVNLAARMVEQAGRSQIIFSRETSDLLGPVFRSFKRRLYNIHVKGKADEVELCELIWRHADDVTMSVGNLTSPRIELPVLRLKYLDREIICRREADTVTIGRDLGCNLVVASNRASRTHCIIERRMATFFLADQSTNGTYVTADGGPEIQLRREEMRLGRQGWISLGQPRADMDAVVEYSCS